MSAASAGGGDADVLVVEDRDSLRTMLRLALESQGYRALEARDQPEAEALLSRHQPAVVITDLRLPHGDGLGVLLVRGVAVGGAGAVAEAEALVAQPCRRSNLPCGGSRVQSWGPVRDLAP